MRSVGSIALISLGAVACGGDGSNGGEPATSGVRPADGPRMALSNYHLPGDESGLIAEFRTDETRSFFPDLLAIVKAKAVIASIKARWSCEQMHQQMKEELGLDHFEGRSWHGLHHHALFSMIALAFLQHVRLHEKHP